MRKCFIYLIVILELAQMQNALKKKRDQKRHMQEDLFKSTTVATLMHVQVLKRRQKKKCANYFLGKAEIGEWTSWTCNKECFSNWYEYQNGRNNKFSRSRSRTCKEFPYFNGNHSEKHPDPYHQCKNINQSQSENGCHLKTMSWCKYKMFDNNCFD